jgi:UTP:GlnB (protein PII) uridylyltransferase
MEASLTVPLRPVPMPDLVITFDNARLPWHTACHVSGPDVPGALQAVAAAFNAARVDVHTARISSSGAELRDRFTVTDRFGRKLDEATMDRVRRAVSDPRKPRPWVRRARRQRPTSVGTNSR